MGFKQLIKVPIRIKSRTFTLIGHILTKNNEKVVQTDIIETYLSDLQLILCTGKTKRKKLNNLHLPL